MKRPRHQPSKTELIARLHRGLRPKLTPDQLSGLSLAHHINVDAIRDGSADEDTLWQYAGGAFTFSCIAQLLETGMPEMAEHLASVTHLIERYGKTGRIAFTGTELQIARTGLQVMDALAEIVDRPTAVLAADWSERQINQLAAAHRAAHPTPASLPKAAA